MTPYEHSEAILLLAQEMIAKGVPMDPNQVNSLTTRIATNLGQEDLKALTEMGMQFEHLGWWSGIQLYAEAHLRSLWNVRINEAKLRAYHAADKRFQSAGEESEVYTYHLNVEGDGSEQRKQLGDLQKKVRQAGDVNAMIAAFEGASFHGWIVPAEELPDAIAEVVEKTPKGSISDPASVELFGNERLVLVLVSDRRPGKPQPFEKVRDEVRKLAVVHQEIKRLKDKGVIEIVEHEEEKTNGFQKTLGFSSTKKEGDEDTSPKTKGRTLQLVVEQFNEGQTEFPFELGAYAEMGLVPGADLNTALSHYRQAADAEDTRAMFRLAELYRAGNGVRADPDQSAAWLKKAEATLESQGNP